MVGTRKRLGCVELLLVVIRKVVGYDIFVVIDIRKLRGCVELFLVAFASSSAVLIALS